MGAEDAKGILLYGPPGTGKTLLAKAVATESEVNFISVKGPEFLSKWVGESEKAVRETFRKARQASPCIIFFDEIDAIAPARGTSCDSHTSERIISQILTELDGLIKLHNVKVIAATNRPDIIDQALLRSGRFDRHIYIPLPDETTRRAIFVVHCHKRPLGKDVDLDMLAARTDGYTGADIAALCNEATMMAIREQVAGAGPSGLKGDALNDKVIHMKHFDEAMKRVRPMSKSELMRYEGFARMFGSHGTGEKADACGCSDGKSGKGKKAKDDGGKAYQ